MVRLQSNLETAKSDKTNIYLVLVLDVMVRNCAYGILYFLLFNIILPRSYSQIRVVRD